MTGPGAGTTRREERDLDRAQERLDEKRGIRTGAEGAEHRSESDAKKGERFLLKIEYNGDVPH